ncbi:MAG: hypothetical protein N3F63_06010 [Thermoplasmata archaeon]|nr:hypothetical protein [Thermoplasmata archaeon]
MPTGSDVSLETDFCKIASTNERVKREQRQKEYRERLKANLLRMFDFKN